jgi:hypothetical protein
MSIVGSVAQKELDSLRESRTDPGSFRESCQIIAENPVR